MVAAHADEIGLMVKQIDENGFLRFIRIGGWYDPTLLSQRVVIHATPGPVFGVVGSTPPHIMKGDERKKPIEAKDRFIDIRCQRQKEAEDLGIAPGTSVSIE
jgi:putative aminopeptidase FrvX